MKTKRTILFAAVITWIAGVALSGALGSVPPQQPEPATAEDYGRWENLGAGALAPDGAHLVVTVRRVDGTSELRLHRVAAPGDEPVRVAEGGGATFSADSRWLAYQIGYAESEREAARDDEGPLRNKVGLRELASGNETIFDDVASFGFDDAGSYLAMRGYPAEGANAADLAVRRLADGATMSFGNVADYAWQPGGALLALSIATESGLGNGVQLYDAASGALRVLDSGDADFLEPTWREDAADLAFLRSAESPRHDDPTHVVVGWRGLDGDTPTEVRFDHREGARLPPGMRVVEHRAPSWSSDGATIFFGIREWPESADAADEATGDAAGETAGPAGGESAATGEPSSGESDTAATRGDEGDQEPEPADVDVWHAFDERIIPMQRVQESRDRAKSYLSAWHLDDDRFVRLGSDLDETVSLLEGERHATETDRAPYVFDGMFGRRWVDLDLIDVATGERTRIAERVRYVQGGSATGRHVLYFADDQFVRYEVATGETVNLTADLPATFVNEQYDYPAAQKPPYGVAGWAADDSAVLLYDRYDVWSVAADGTAAAKLTDGADDEIRHRYVRLDPEARGIDAGEPMFLSTYGQWSKKSGYARLDPAPVAAAGDTAGNGAPASGGGDGGGGSMATAPGGFRTDGPTPLVWLDKSVSRLTRADEAEAFAYVVQAFDDPPDYWVGDGDLDGAARITDTNAFHDDYAWGRAELLDYSCDFGERVQAALMYPAGYTPGQRYPMITYVYELRSQTLHSYSVPSERSPYNPAVWTAQGYFVLQPDIVYRDRMPGTSAVECVRPAVQAAVDTGMVDADRVGLVGHSWGGYEAAFIPTKTDIFAASVSGAALTNFYSMFGTIHWNQGLPESSHFETGQARMDVPYWEDMEAYARESPVIGIPDLETPMLMAFGDADGTVDWHQGIEMYNYARRAGKFFVMLVYEGENHSNRQKKNQVDYHHRVLQWFGHFLKGEDAAPWITDGVSVIERNDALKRR